MDKYFTFKFYLEYGVLLALVAMFIIITVFMIISAILGAIKEKRINRFFTSHGYERRLLGVASLGAKSFYGWVRSSDHKVADDRDIKHMSMKQIKDKYM